MNKTKIMYITCPSCGREVKITVEWQDESRTEEEFERVYETRYDCRLGPG